MQCTNLVILKKNSNFSKLFFFKICFYISFILNSKNLRYFVIECSKLNSLNIVNVIISNCTYFSNVSSLFYIWNIITINKINREEMNFFCCIFSFFLIVPCILNIDYSQHKTFSLKQIFFLIKIIVGWKIWKSTQCFWAFIICLLIIWIFILILFCIFKYLIIILIISR